MTPQYLTRFFGLALLFASPLTAEVRQSRTHGLLVIDLGQGKQAGEASEMNAMRLPENTMNGSDGFEIRYNQPVGDMMRSANREVAKFMMVRHGDELGTDNYIELSFADRHVPKDGPSAAVPVSLMVESLLTQTELAPDFASTGDMAATGEVRPVGGVIAKLIGAAQKDINVVAIPHANRSVARDLYVTYGVAAFLKLQIVSVESFEEAWSLAQAERPADVRKALDLYAEVQSSSPQNSKENMDKLKEVLEILPGHQSARSLALHLMGRGPRTLSVGGSLEAIDEAWAELSVVAGVDGFWTNRELKTRFGSRVNKVARLQQKVDPRVMDYLQSLLAIGKFVDRYHGRKRLPDSVIAEWDGGWEELETQAAALRSNPSVQADLNGD